MPQDEIMGTVFKVDGTWYVRLLHGGGNLTRLEGARELLGGLLEGDLVGVDGYVSRDHLGQSQMVHAKSVRRLGGADESVKL